MKTLILTLVISLFLTACQYDTLAQIYANNARHQGHDHMQRHAAHQPTGATAENSLDWAGVYAGKIPCPECDAIHIELTLLADKTYRLQEQHWRQNQVIHSHQSSGRFDFDERQTSLIRLDAQAHGRTFFIGEGFAQARNQHTGGKLVAAADYRIAQTQRY